MKIQPTCGEKMVSLTERNRLNCQRAIGLSLYWMSWLMQDSDCKSWSLVSAKETHSIWTLPVSNLFHHGYNGLMQMSRASTFVPLGLMTQIPHRYLGWPVNSVLSKTQVARLNIELEWVEWILMLREAQSAVDRGHLTWFKAYMSTYSIQRGSFVLC